MSTPAITFIACGPGPGDSHPEEWLLVGLVDDGTEQRKAIEESDARERLMCDCCQEYQSRYEDMITSGNERLCKGCAGETNDDGLSDETTETTSECERDTVHGHGGAVSLFGERCSGY